MHPRNANKGLRQRPGAPTEGFRNQRRTWQQQRRNDRSQKTKAQIWYLLRKAHPRKLPMKQRTASSKPDKFAHFADNRRESKQASLGVATIDCNSETCQLKFKTVILPVYDGKHHVFMCERARRCPLCLVSERDSLTCLRMETCIMSPHLTATMKSRPWHTPETWRCRLSGQLRGARSTACEVPHSRS